MTDAELLALAEMAKPSGPAITDWAQIGSAHWRAVGGFNFWVMAGKSSLRWSVSWRDTEIKEGSTPVGDDPAASLVVAKAACEDFARAAGLAVPL